MSRLSASIIDWVQDRIFRRVLRNSSYLFIGSVINALMVMVTTRLLGVSAYGMLGIITVFVSDVNRLLSFRMGDVVVRYMGEYVQHKEMDKAAALVKAAGITEALTSIVAYGVLLWLAPFGVQFFIKDPSIVDWRTIVPLVQFFGLSILGNLTTETATGVLQVTNHYRSQALINVFQTFLVAGILTYSYFAQGGMLMVITAYLLGKMVLGMGPIFVALYHMDRMFGHTWWKASLNLLPPKKELIRFALSTNFSATINMIVRDSEVLWVGHFFTTLESGYFKAAMTIINPVTMPIQPFISTTYPELNRAIVEKQWARLRKLLRQVTTFAGAWTGAVALGLVFFGQQVIFLPWVIFGHPIFIFGKAFSPLKSTYLPSYWALLVLLIGYGVANVLYWNRSLLLALGEPNYPLKVMFWGMVVKVGLSIVVLSSVGAGQGFIAEAWLMSAYFVVTVGLTTWRGLQIVHTAERTALAEVAE
jgi:O-antigen/teichoic acid export membrane protein